MPRPCLQADGIPDLTRAGDKPKSRSGASSVSYRLRSDDDLERGTRRSESEVTAGVSSWLGARSPRPWGLGGRVPLNGMRISCGPSISRRHNLLFRFSPSAGSARAELGVLRPVGLMRGLGLRQAIVVVFPVESFVQLTRDLFPCWPGAVREEPGKCLGYDLPGCDGIEPGLPAGSAVYAPRARCHDVLALPNHAEPGLL